MSSMQKPRPSFRSTTGLLVCAVAALPLVTTGCGREASARPGTDPGEMRVLLLGMDGLDPVLLQRLMDEGRLPTFKRLAESGTFQPLETSMPPQSPVAWSNFITGADPGVHEIWDFIHRDPTNTPPLPKLSTSDQTPVPRAWYQAIAPDNIDLGDWRIPLAGGSEPQLTRQGPTFWEPLVKAGIDTTVYRVPANYPAVAVEGHGTFRCLCGMGTPDLKGGYGSYTAYLEDLERDFVVRDGGDNWRLDFDGPVATAPLHGPENFLRKPEKQRPTDRRETVPDLEMTIRFVRDVEAGTIQITLGDNEPLLMKAGDWSDWQRVYFQTGLPGSTALSAIGMPTSIPTILQVYVRSIEPAHVYFSPLQIDPVYPLFPVSTPAEFSAQLAERTGLYHTEGIPEATAGLEANVLSEDEFLQMAEQLVRTRVRQYRAALAAFSEGVLFYYFGHTDQLAHIFWQDLEDDGDYAHVVPDAYVQMDGLLAEALDVLDENDVVIVLSDHGFNSFRRGFNVNTWLEQNGYQVWRGKTARFRNLEIGNIDFTRSRAYAMGINSLYLNLAGREAGGIVDPAHRQALLDEISAKLLEVRDEDGSQVIARVYDVQQEHPDADPMIAPDLLIGYARDYRGSWKTALGGMKRDILEDNEKFWRGDHCIAHFLVPGSLVTNLKTTVDNPSLSDLAPSLLDLYGLAAPDGMKGRKIFAPR